MKFLRTVLVISVVMAVAMEGRLPDQVSYIAEIGAGKFNAVERIIQTAVPEARLRWIDRDLEIGLVDFPVRTSRSRIDSVMTVLSSGSMIRNYYEDRRISIRVAPDDPLYEEQWDMRQIDLEKAWDLSTGGNTAEGDEIVVAILDAGYDTLHADLTGNYWTNQNEVPGDGLDNDSNGYVDDYLGLNIQTGNDNHNRHFHGTGVAGIIGATGNNMLGVTGANWNVRILLVSGIERESDIIEGYAYIREIREAYNQSGGTEGAFIVATNLSAGIDGAFAQDHPVWCAAYDNLGAVGILSIAATTNSNVLVDEEGDMPSTCQSDYLVMVTNTTADDEKMNPAGYGPVNIDLGAPGTSSKTTNIDQGYQDFPGTSAATPHVTGVAALLYSMPCPAFISQAKSDPASAALVVKSAIMDGVDKFQGLTEFTRTGGRLNAFGSTQYILNICNGTGGELKILEISPNPVFGMARIEYQTPDFDSYDWYVFDSSGRMIMHDKVLPAGGDIKVRSLDFSNFASGVYFIFLEGSGGSTSAKVVVPG